MSDLNLQRMKIQLIQGGIAPKFVKRTLAELDAHYRDLKTQAISDGCLEAQASKIASAAIGDEKTLVDEILNRQELKSWFWRYPKFIFLIFPLLTLILCGFASAAVFLFIYNSFPEISEMLATANIPLWAKVLIEGLSFFNFYLLTPLIAMGIVVIVKQRMIRSFWPIIGMALLIFVGCGWQYSINWPIDGLQGNLNFQWGYSFLPRPVKNFHDLHNLTNILISIALATSTWWAYRPNESHADDV